MSIVGRIREWFDTEKTVRLITDDKLVISELILHIRIIYEDGVMGPEEIRCFKEICESAFGIPEEDLPKVFIYIKDIGFDISLSEAAANFRDTDKDRKQALLDRMYRIAKSDGEVKSAELDIIRRTADVMGVNAHKLISNVS